MSDKLTPEALSEKMERAWAYPDPADAANLLRGLVVEAIAALAAAQERVRELEAREEALRAIASGTWKRGDLHSAALDGALASGDKVAFRFGFMSWAQALARKALAAPEPPGEEGT